MDPEITALASTAGSAVVVLMASDAWPRLRDGVAGLWHRTRPDRTEAIGAELDSARAEMLAARSTGDTMTEEELRHEWQGRLRRLMTTDPAAVDDLRALLEAVARDIRAATPTAPMRATASGHGRVYQAGRDQHITET